MQTKKRQTTKKTTTTPFEQAVKNQNNKIQKLLKEVQTLKKDKDKLLREIHINTQRNRLFENKLKQRDSDLYDFRQRLTNLENTIKNIKSN